MCELPPIDSGYTGEVHAIISNVGNTAYKIKADDKIGQLMILPIVIPDFTYESWKERGTGAFGSTGRLRRKKMSYKLVIAEKPSVAQSIAKVIRSR